jgi:hypothetical protein
MHKACTLETKLKIFLIILILWLILKNLLLCAVQKTNKGNLTNKP